MGATVSCADGCGAQYKGSGVEQFPSFWRCNDCCYKRSTEMVPPWEPVVPARGTEDYGPTCNARFCLPEQVCGLPPHHAGEHVSRLQDVEDASLRTWVSRLGKIGSSKDAAERFDVLTWAGARPGVLSLLRALKEKNYDETGTEYLQRVVDGQRCDRTTHGPWCCVEAPTEVRRELRGALVEGGAVALLEECKCSFVSVTLEDVMALDGPDLKTVALFERVSGAACEVHGGAALSAELRNESAEPRVMTAFLDPVEPLSPSPLSIDPARPASIGLQSHEPGCPCVECS